VYFAAPTYADATTRKRLFIVATRKGASDLALTVPQPAKGRLRASR